MTKLNRNSRFLVHPCIILILALILLLSPVTAEPPDLPSSLDPNLSRSQDIPVSSLLVRDGKAVIYFFYNTNCGECLETLPYIEEFAATRPDVVVTFIDVRESDENLALFKAFKEYYGTGPIPVPSVFVGNITLSGNAEITGGLEAAANQTIVALPTPRPETGKPSSGELTLPLVIASALVDGINPCAFAVLIFLLVTIMSLESRRKVLVVGSVFILAVFIFYFLSGLGIFAIIQSAGISRLISAIAAVIALAAGTISIISVFGTGNGQSVLSIPESKKGIIDRYIRKASIPAAFAVGILVGMFELPCTGGIYLAILSLLSNRMSLMEGIPYLLVYNFFFILPLIVILGIVAYGLPVERLDQWRTEYRKAIRVIMGVIMILLGIILILELL
jgi:cytochrome c biogenesis protein CcdA